MGPVCRGKSAGITTNHPGGIAAQYRIVKAEHAGPQFTMIWIEDIGQNCRSVTNDAEAVVRAIADEYGNARIIYKDSDGSWDELKHQRGLFTGFAPARDLAPPT